MKKIPVLLPALLHGPSSRTTLDSCRYVRIANCHIYTGDDAIVLKATSHRKCQHVTVTNCVLSGAPSSFKLGTESNGSFEDITCSNCTIYDSNSAGIALMMVDGARFGRVNVSNITMRGVKVPLFIRLGNRARPLPGEKKPGVGTLRDIVISNVQAAVISPVGCSITGIPGHPAENITLENIRFHFVGGGTAEQAAREVPELEGAYPKGPMFGVLPAYGFYCRHVRNLRLHNIDLDCQRRDLRPAVVCDDVQDLDLFGLRAEIDSEASGVVRLIHCRGALIHGCRAYEPIPTFLRVEGDRSEKMYLTGNDLRDAKHPVLAGPNVPKDAVEGVEVNRE